MAKPLSEGTRVFFRHQQDPEKSWEQGTVAEVEETAKGLKYTVKDVHLEHIENIPGYDVHRLLDGIDLVKPDDLLQLSELHVAVLLSVLKNRFRDDNIYTHIGNLIIALNPFKWTIEHYQPEQSAAYIREGWQGAPLSRTTLRPHSWAVANKSYWDMVSHGNQSILISGESGAGKTEGAKIILRYFGDLCTTLLRNEDAGDEAITAITSINDKLQQSSPILESFGNAKTTRNDNSSRFGKFMKIQFNAKGILVGMHNTPYLLEKSRVVQCGADERLYHAFYQLAIGASAEQKERYMLDAASSYPMLQMGGCLSIPKVNDTDDFNEVLSAMKTVGFTEDESDSCWKVIAACLHLSKVEFENNEKDASVISSGAEYIERAAKMLSIDPASLQTSLLTMTRSMGKDVVRKPMNMLQSRDTRNSLSIFLYEKMFLWIVNKINDVVSQPSQEAHWIGLLDIFGFENFRVNSFEQLCINLANERLQKHYNTYVYDKDLQECQQEGIQQAHKGVAVNDNQACLDLIMAGKNSVYSLLDDVCKSTQTGDAADDRKFLDSMIERFGGEQNKEKGSKRNAEGQVIVKREKASDYFEYDPRRPGQFSIWHYAGKVSYNIDGFVGKNIDLLSEEIKSLCRTTTDAVVKQLMPRAPLPGEKQRKTTVSSTFKASLNELIDTIQSTEPNWVRCIRPNPQKVQDVFHSPSVLDQLTCSGVVETVKTRQQGYCYRIPFDEFFSRYSVMGDRSISGKREKCQSVLYSLKTDKSEAQVGKTKVFLRVKAFQKIEETRDGALKTHVLHIQRCMQWRASCVRVLDKRSAVMGRRLQKWLQLLTARDRIVSEHYRKVFAVLKQTQRRAREVFLQKNSEERHSATTEEVNERRDLRAMHKENLRPLWKAVIIRIQTVESNVRDNFDGEEHLAFNTFSPLKESSYKIHKKKERDRKKMEKLERKLQRSELSDKESEARIFLEEDEDEARLKIRRVWIPVRDRLASLAARIVHLNARRDKKLRQYRHQRDAEVKRQSADARKAVREESALWTSFARPHSATLPFSYDSDVHTTHPPHHSHYSDLDVDSEEERDIHRECGRLAGWEAALSAADCGFDAVSTGFPEPPPHHNTTLTPFLRASNGSNTKPDSPTGHTPSQSITDYYKGLFNIPTSDAYSTAPSQPNQTYTEQRAVPASTPPLPQYRNGGGGGGGGGGGVRQDYPIQYPHNTTSPPRPHQEDYSAHREYQGDYQHHHQHRPLEYPSSQYTTPSRSSRYPGYEVDGFGRSASESKGYGEGQEGVEGEQGGGGFFDAGQGTALAALGEMRQQEERFYRACVPSTLITAPDPEFAAVDSYSGYTAYWRDSYAKSASEKDSEAHMRALIKEQKRAMKRRARLDKVL